MMAWVNEQANGPTISMQMRTVLFQNSSHWSGKLVVIDAIYLR